jgi:hypothetical protein
VMIAGPVAWASRIRPRRRATAPSHAESRASRSARVAPSGSTPIARAASSSAERTVSRWARSPWSGLRQYRSFSAAGRSGWTFRLY